MVYVARYLAKVSDKVYSFKESFLELWVPVGGVLVLILPANFSTTALIFAMICMLIFIGQYPLKYLGYVLAMGVSAMLLFILLAKAFPDNKFFSRVNTWEKRIERFTKDTPNEDDYQIEKAKIGIASGKIYGLGPGKSVQKNFLPQYAHSLDSADAAAVFYSQHTLAIKQLPNINEQDIQNGFANNTIAILNNTRSLTTWLNNKKNIPAIFVLMSSGNYDGVDVVAQLKIK